MKDEIGESLVTLLAEELDKRLALKRLAKLVGGKTILGEAVVELVEDWKRRGIVKTPESRKRGGETHF